MLPRDIQDTSGNTHARRRWRAWLLLAALLAPLPATALDPNMPFRDYVLENWSTSHGLPQISVQSIARDRAGFLWLGTQNGVARFDGQNFRAYDSAGSGVDLSLVVAAWGDRDGAVWFGNSHGLVREQHGRFRQWPIGAVNMIVGGTGDLPLLASNQGVGLWRDGALHPLPGLAGVFFSVLRRGDTIWAGGLDRVCRRQAGQTRCWKLPAGPSRRVVALAWLQDRLWVGTNAGLLQLHADRFTAVAPLPALAGTDIQALLADRSGSLWIGTIGALYRRYPDGRLERIGAGDLPANSWIEAMYQGRNGTLWLGSRTQALYRVSDSYTRRYDAGSGLTDPFVWSLAPGADGSLDIGSNDGLYRLQDGRAQRVIAGAQLPNAAVYALYRDARGRLWLGTRGGVALWTDGRLQTPPQLAPLRSWQVSDITEYPRGTYWFATHGGLFRLHGGHLARYGAHLRVRALLPLAGDALLLGTDSGVYAWRDGHIRAPAWGAPLRGHFVTGFGWLDRHSLLLTTLDAGIGVLRGGRLQMYTRADGLPSNNAWTFLLHGDAAYFSSIRGVWRIARAALLQGRTPFAAQTVLGSDNRIGNMQRTRCCNGGGGGRMLLQDDTLWLPSINGALALNLAHLPPLPTAPRPRIEGHDGQWYGADARLRMPLGQRNLQINYTAAELRDGTELNFRYRLLGYDADWTLAGTRRSAFYTDLPSGDYRFEVQSRIGNGGWSPAASLALVLPAHWYEWRWLQVLIAVLVIATLLALLRLWARRAAHRQRRLEALVAERTEALRRANERLRQANDALTAESLSDPLTGLGNRRLLAQRWPQLRDSDRLTVLLVDLDHFKRINDRYGHPVGDQVLRAVAELLHLQGEHDLALRWGGEEFMLLLPGQDAAAALALAERIRLAVRAHRFSDPALEQVRITCSIGCSQWPLLPTMRTDDLGGAIELADFAMYRVKSQGRDGCLALLPGAAATRALLTAPAADVERLLRTGVLRWLAAG